MLVRSAHLYQRRIWSVIQLILQFTPVVKVTYNYYLHFCYSHYRH